MHPQPGDILVSRSSGNVEHQIGVVPDPPHESLPSHDRAVRKACEMAEARHVDAWLTEDLIHFLRLATFRPERAREQPHHQRG
jgi:hypothetical protein